MSYYIIRRGVFQDRIVNFLTAYLIFVPESCIIITKQHAERMNVIMKKKILPPRLCPGDTIGIASPSGIVKPESIERAAYVLGKLGYRVKPAGNLYSDSWGFLASDEERAADINELAADPEVKMVSFYGGEGSPALLPLLDYETIKNNPKIYSSYSDGTTVLSAITAMTGLVTYYGQTPGVFGDLRYYNYTQFCENFVSGEHRFFDTDSGWQSIRAGVGEGVLIGGYSRNFAMMFGSPYFSFDPNADYILFIEDHERFSKPDAVSEYLAAIWQHPFMRRVRGFIFGCYNNAGTPPEELVALLVLIGERYDIPVAYTNDIGHGTRHGVLPMGCRVRLDGGAGTLEFLERTIARRKS